MAQRNTFMCDEYAHDNSTEHDEYYSAPMLDARGNPSSLYNGIYSMTGAQTNPISTPIGFGSCTGIGRSYVEEESDDEVDEPTVIIVPRNKLIEQWTHVINALVSSDEEDVFSIKFVLEYHLINRHELHHQLSLCIDSHDVPLETRIRRLHKKQQIHL